MVQRNNLNGHVRVTFYFNHSFMHETGRVRACVVVLFLGLVRGARAHLNVSRISSIILMKSGDLEKDC